MMIAVKLYEFITPCGILRGSIYVDGILSSFLFCLCCISSNEYIFYDRLHVQCPMCCAIAGCVNFRTMLHSGFELPFRWFRRAVTQNEQPHMHVSRELELFVWRRRSTSCTSDPSYRVTWNTSLLFCLIKTELIVLKSHTRNKFFNDQGNTRVLQNVSALYFLKNLYVTDMRTTLLFNIISRLLDTFSPTICKLLNAVGKESLWLTAKPVMHHLFHLIISCKSTTS